LTRRVANVAKADCGIVTYTTKACEIATYDTDCAGHTYYATPDEPDDCDVEFRFSGYQTKVYGTNWFARQLIGYWGECGIARRHTASYTRLLFGQLGVFFWIGSPTLTESRLKMQ
jgi:hypothetical protein